jgi:hypothetical protein
MDYLGLAFDGLTVADDAEYDLKAVRPYDNKSNLSQTTPLLGSQALIKPGQNKQVIERTPKPTDRLSMSQSTPLAGTNPRQKSRIIHLPAQLPLTQVDTYMYK